MDAVVVRRPSRLVSPKDPVHKRRGVLLLVVLSVLTLFMMLGVSYVTIATRAKRAAKAFANNVATATAFGAAEQNLCDQVFLTVVRGSQESLANAAALGSGAGGNENLLADKYGSTSITGTVTAAANFSTGTNGGFIQLTFTGLNPAPPNVSDLAGRVITITAPGLSVSTRILQATGAASSPAVVVAGGPTPSGKQLSLGGLTTALGVANGTVVINGREFAGTSTSVNEPWDGIDAQNPLLAQIKLQDSNGNGVQDSGEKIYYDMSTFALGVSGTLPQVDNDGDGFYDSRFIDLNLPAVVTQSGIIYPKAAVLVADLDGRLNLNAHGGVTDEACFDTAANRDMYPTLPVSLGSVPLYQLPRGAGVGPAEVSLDRSLIFGGSPSTNQARVANSTTGNSGLSNPSNNGGGIDTATGRYIPFIINVDGRYADAASAVGGTVNAASSAKPGISGTNDVASIALDQWRGSLSGSNVAQCFFTASGSSRFGTPPDIKGQMRVWVDDAGRPVYYKPVWRSSSGGSATQPPTAIYNDAVDDPYEVNLSRSGPRVGGSRTPTSAAAASSTAADELFTPGELEAVLRFYDPDSPKLPSRLVALLQDGPSAARHAITTESWDTSAIVGDAWQQVVGTQFASLLTTTGLTSPNRPQDLFSPEVLIGHRMDINRPFHDVPNYSEPNDTTGTQRRQAFAKQLYCLLVAIATKNGTTVNAAVAEQLAQYAVNVVDFRDADSVMTRFPYDPNFSPTNTTWSPGATNVVWGCERPEVIITETWAWHDRRTNDLTTPGGKVNDSMTPVVNRDPHFDQQRRPQGAFFVELYSPWGSTAREYDSAATATRTVAAPAGSANAADEFRADPLPTDIALNEDANGNGSLDAGEDTNGNGTLDTPERRSATIDLSKAAPSSSPVWRLVTVRGTSAFGTDPVVATGTNSTLSILDPARPGSTATIDRAFYFTQPSGTIQASTGTNSAFWQTATGGLNPSPSTYVVVGTNAPFHPLTSGTAAANVRVLVGPSGQPATISEPLCATDPYVALMSSQSPGNTYTGPNSGNSYAGQWTTAIDPPLDLLVSGSGGITSAPFLRGGNPLLMYNGTHDNFAVVHLQRLANPATAWNATTNPYVTVDSMTVDLTVVNTDASSGSPSQTYDEPGITGSSPLAYLTAQNKYGSSASAPFSNERGGKVSQIIGTPPRVHDIWSAVVNAAAPLLSVDDAASFRSVAIGTRTANAPGTPTAFSYSISASGTTSPGDTHSLSFAPERFFDTSSPSPKTYAFAWMFWPNRPYNSAAELAFVPAVSQFSLLQRHTTGTPNPQPFFHLPGFFETATPRTPWAALGGRTATVGAGDRTIWHFLHVPTPYASIYRSVPNTAANSAALADLGLDIFPINQLSSFREPGRINVNMIGDKRTWRGMFGEVTDRDDLPNPASSAPASERIPQWSQNLFVTTSATATNPPCVSWLSVMQNIPAPGKKDRPSPVRSGSYLDTFVNEDVNQNGVLDAGEDANGNGVLDTGEDTNGNGVLDPAEDTNGNGILDRNDYRDTGRHSYFRYQTTARLMNSTTVRSNVFAIWVTIGYFDSTGNEVAPATRNRAFYIFDRSIPVGYELGKNHNVFDAVLLRRIIQ